MDAFEQVVSEILWMDGYWVRNSVKVELTKEEKRAIGRPSSPRWEIDVVAYSGKQNLLLAVECKSFLDSRGVALRAFDGSSDKDAKRYKLFTDANLKKVVLGRLRKQLANRGACSPNAKIKPCLVCGRIAGDADREGMHEHFAAQGWQLWDERWLRKQLKRMSELGYENQVSPVVAKLLLKGKLDE
jgi:hypothetical protein